MRKSILTLGIAAVLTGVLATCSMAYAADDELAQIQESGKLKSLLFSIMQKPLKPLKTAPTPSTGNCRD